MRRILLSVLVLACSLFVFDRADCRPGGDGGGSATATFQAVNGSGVTGRVTLRGDASRTTISVSLAGLQPDVEYVASWSTNVSFDLGPIPPVGAFYRFRGNKRGTASIRQSVLEPFDQIHSISILKDTGYGLALVAGAPVN